ncbi:unnamed protein product [Thlaspi arvense]|uniref:ACB domain-containing protein n=1 Tax=Thlaspi arvense TaxID=13288 RepID=A0AAU9T549_THLAR|nr:unnamed protein product [Thlaspi arvense]
MEFLLEMLLTAVVSLLFSFLVAKLVSASMAGNIGGVGNDQAEIGVGDGFVKEELRFGMKMDAPVVQSERNFRVVDENVGHVDRFGSEADRVGDELQEAAKGGELAVPTAEAEAKSLPEVSPENVIAEELIVRGEDQRRDSVEEISGEIGTEHEELIVRTAKDESTASFTQEGRSVCAENVKSEDDVVAESEEVSVAESSSTVKISNLNTEGEGEDEEKEELSVEEDDDWEGIEKTELEKAFASAAKLLEESGKSEEIGAEAKMELYGLHKIATEGSCREAQPMAVMVSARAKWNAWQKLGNMTQEEAMEQYLALVAKEVPGLMSTGHTVGKMSEMETSVDLPPNSGSLDDPTTLDTTGAESSKNDNVKTYESSKGTYILIVVTFGMILAIANFQEIWCFH